MLLIPHVENTPRPLRLRPFSDTDNFPLSSVHPNHPHPAVELGKSKLDGLLWLDRKNHWTQPPNIPSHAQAIIGSSQGAKVSAFQAHLGIQYFILNSVGDILCTSWPSLNVIIARFRTTKNYFPSFYYSKLEPYLSLIHISEPTRPY